MRRALPLLVAALLLALACGRPEWTTISSPEGGFQVEMPAPPEQLEHRVPTEVGVLDFTILNAELRGASFQVAWVDYPLGSVEEPEALLDAARDGALAATGSVLLAEEPFELDGHPGREIEFDVQGRLRGRDRLLLVGNRLYQLLLATEPPDVRGPVANRFLDSFRLLPAS